MKTPETKTSPCSPDQRLHVAIIMDGNGRWARQRGLRRSKGHAAGAESVRRVVAACPDLGVHYLTLYAFSTENWRRPMREVTELMRLLGRFIDERLDELQEHGVRLNAIGELDRLPMGARGKLRRAIAKTAGNTEGVLTLALSYGSRAEITHAARQLAVAVAEGRLSPDDITEEQLAGALYTVDLPDPDLIIRTGGEMRLSNFLLWQASYAEFWSTPTLWPDFTRETLQEALSVYAGRQRRYGGVTDV